MRTANRPNKRCAQWFHCSSIIIWVLVLNDEFSQILMSRDLGPIIHNAVEIWHSRPNDLDLTSFINWLWIFTAWSFVLLCIPFPTAGHSAQRFGRFHVHSHSERPERFCKPLIGERFQSGRISLCSHVGTPLYGIFKENSKIIRVIFITLGMISIPFVLLFTFYIGLLNFAPFTLIPCLYTFFSPCIVICGHLNDIDTHNEYTTTHFMYWPKNN